LTLPLPLTLPLTLALLPLTLALLPLALALLPLTLALLPLAGVGKFALDVLQRCGCPGQIAVGRDPLAGTLERFAEPTECLLRARRVALGEALGRVAQRGRRCPVRLRGRGAHLCELPGEIAELRLGHSVELVAELLEVLTGRLRIAIRVRVGLAGRRP
jgi:hypothetical protein